MKKVLLAMLALTLGFVSCDKDEKDDEGKVELVRKVTIDGKSYDLLDTEVNYGQSSNEYGFSSVVRLEDGYSSVFGGFFREELVGKDIDAVKKSDYDYLFYMNGVLPYKDKDDLIYGVQDLFIRNMDGKLETTFKSGTVKFEKSGDYVTIKIDGTLNKGAHFTYQNYTDIKDLVVY